MSDWRFTTGELAALETDQEAHMMQMDNRRRSCRAYGYWYTDANLHGWQSHDLRP